MIRSNGRLMTLALSAAVGLGSVKTAFGQFPGPWDKDPQTVEIQQVGFFGKRKKVCDPCEGPAIILAEPEMQPAPLPDAVKPSEPPPAEQPTAPPAPSAQAPIAPVPEEPVAPTTDPFAGAFDVASSDSIMAPNMLGDFAGTVFAAERPQPPQEGLTAAENAQVRTISRYKVADFNSPVPKTRLLYDFNYFGDAFQTGGQVYRNFGGVEYAFFGEMMSVEVRGTLNTFQSFPDAIDKTEFGDIRSVFKMVVYRNGSNVFTSGVGMTWPTGGLPQGVPGVYAMTPYVGYLFMSESSPLFLQGFNQLDVPFHADDQLLMHTDLGVGYWLRRFDPTRTISGIAPTVELHLYTPIGDSPSGDLLGLRYNDVLNMTVGSSIFVGRNVLVAVGLGIPLSNITDYDIEAQFHFEWRFGGFVNRAIPNIL